MKKGWHVLTEGWCVLCGDEGMVFAVWWWRDGVCWQRDGVYYVVMKGWCLLCGDEGMVCIDRGMLCIVWWWRDSVCCVVMKGWCVFVWWWRDGVCCVLTEAWCVFCDDWGMVSVVQSLIKGWCVLCGDEGTVSSWTLMYCQTHRIISGWLRDGICIVMTEGWCLWYCDEGMMCIVSWQRDWMVCVVWQHRDGMCCVMTKVSRLQHSISCLGSPLDEMTEGGVCCVIIGTMCHVMTERWDGLCWGVMTEGWCMWYYDERMVSVMW